MTSNRDITHVCAYVQPGMRIHVRYLCKKDGYPECGAPLAGYANQDAIPRWSSDLLKSAGNVR